jgi:hypothetical protein
MSIIIELFFFVLLFERTYSNDFGGAQQHVKPIQAHSSEKPQLFSPPLATCKKAISKPKGEHCGHTTDGMRLRDILLEAYHIHRVMPVGLHLYHLEVRWLMQLPPFFVVNERINVIRRLRYLSHDTRLTRTRNTSKQEEGLCTKCSD